MQENDKFCCTYKQYKICPKMEIPTTKYLADYLYVVHEDVPFRYYRKVSNVNKRMNECGRNILDISKLNYLRFLRLKIFCFVID